jgi:hypothetical protein
MIENFLNVNIFVQHNFKSVLAKMSYGTDDNPYVISMAYKKS